MRRALIPPTLALAFLLILTSLAAATTITFSATLKENFGRAASAQQCVEEAQTLTCFGTGAVAGLGRVTETLVVDFSGETPNRTRTWVFSDGSTLITSETFGLFSSPGNSGGSQGVFHSYGNPAFQTGSWTVTGGTGLFADASGAGTIKLVLAGDTIVLTFSGSLTY